MKKALGASVVVTVARAVVVDGAVPARDLLLLLKTHNR